jgi:hypothetical protein
MDAVKEGISDFASGEVRKLVLIRSSPFFG